MVLRLNKAGGVAQAVGGDQAHLPQVVVRIHIYIYIYICLYIYICIYPPRASLRQPHGWARQDLPAGWMCAGRGSACTWTRVPRPRYQVQRFDTSSGDSTGVYFFRYLCTSFCRWPFTCEHKHASASNPLKSRAPSRCWCIVLSLRCKPCKRPPNVRRSACELQRQIGGPPSRTHEWCLISGSLVQFPSWHKTCRVLSKRRTGRARRDLPVQMLDLAGDLHLLGVRGVEDLDPGEQH